MTEEIEETPPAVGRDGHLINKSMRNLPKPTRVRLNGTVKIINGRFLRISKPTADPKATKSQRKQARKQRARSR